LKYARLHRELIDEDSMYNQDNAFINEKVVYSVNDSLKNSALSQIVNESSISHHIECSRHVHAQERDHLVVALISDDVNLLRKKLQSCLDESVSSNSHLRIKKKSMSLR
jgi:phenylalanyl-tRNA synthetase beta subunit